MVKQSTFVVMVRGQVPTHSLLLRSICGDLSRQDVLSFFTLRPAQGSTLIRTGLVVHLHELGNVKLWLLQDLDLPDKAILQWVDALALFLDLLANNLWNQFLHEVSQLSLACFF